MESRPLVTVIALCYNHARFLVETLDSIRVQTFTDYELIVTDDASRDNSPDLIRAWLAEHRPHARFIQHTRNAGLCRTLNEALAVARGSYICMIATDDTWYPDRLERHMAAMAGQPDSVAVVYSDADQMDEDGHTLPKQFISHYRPDLAPPSGRIFSTLADRNFIPAMAATIRTSALATVGGYDEALSFEDYDMWLRLSLRFDFVFCPGTVARYRIVATSMIRTMTTRPTGHHLYTEVLIAGKLLATGQLSARQQAQWAQLLGDAAYKLYLGDDQRAGRALWLSFRYNRKPRLLFLAATSALGLSRSRLKRWLGSPASSAE